VVTRRTDFRPRHLTQPTPALAHHMQREHVRKIIESTFISLDGVIRAPAEA